MLQPNWDGHRVAIMRSLLGQKFEREPFRSKLLATGDQELVEGNRWHDQFWGKCSCPRHSIEPGQNTLGVLLMEIRRDLGADPHSGERSDSIQPVGGSLSEADLDRLESLSAAVDPGPWTAMVEGRDHTAGDSFIQIGDGSTRLDDMYVSRDHTPAGPNDLDLIAAARNALPLLVAEVRRSRSNPDDPG